MRILYLLTLSAALISLSACSSMSGNVVPKTGPTMEQVYDSMGRAHAHNAATTDHTPRARLHTLRQKLHTQKIARTAHTAAPRLPSEVNRTAVNREFKPLPNPELKLYVYPHLAGSAQAPIPGYYTAVNAYNRTYYALPHE